MVKAMKSKRLRMRKTHLLQLELLFQQALLLVQAAELVDLVLVLAADIEVGGFCSGFFFARELSIPRKKAGAQH
jgi:hypothetical protein